MSEHYEPNYLAEALRIIFDTVTEEHPCRLLAVREHLLALWYVLPTENQDWLMKEYGIRR